MMVVVVVVVVAGGSRAASLRRVGANHDCIIVMKLIHQSISSVDCSPP